MKQLTLYSRTGCCLCEGLESRLRDLDLLGLSIELTVMLLAFEMLTTSLLPLPIVVWTPAVPLTDRVVAFAPNVI